MDNKEIDAALVAASIAEAEGYTGTAEAFINMVDTMQRNLCSSPVFEIERTTPPDRMGH